jgi:hypothetical protein
MNYIDRYNLDITGDRMTEDKLRNSQVTSELQSLLTELEHIKAERDAFKMMYENEAKRTTAMCKSIIMNGNGVTASDAAN